MAAAAPRKTARLLHVSRATVHLCHRRYGAERLTGLVDRPRSGRPTVLDRRTVERILLLTTERVPVEATHWSTRLMARYAGGTQWQVRQVWQAADLKPHRLKTFTLSRDPQFAEKVIDVVGLYLPPPTTRWCSRSTRRRRSRPSTGPIPCSRYGPGRSSAAPTTTSGMGPRICMRPQCRDRGSARPDHPPSSRHGIPPVPRADPTRDAARLGAAPDRRQQQHAHDRSDSRLPGRPSPLSPARHADERFMPQMRSRPGSASWSGAPSGEASSLHQRERTARRH